MVNLTDKQLDILTELINIGIGQGAKMLNEMIESQINLQVPFLKLLAKVEVQEVLRQRLGYDKLSSIQLDFKGYFAGSAKLVFPRESAANLVAVLTGKNLENADLDIVQIGTLTEVGNIVINGVMGSLGNKLYKQIYYDVPCYAEEDIAQLLPMEEPNNSVLLAQAKFDIEDLQITGDIILFFKVGSFDGLLSVIEDLD
ncbi:MAG: chemotaxis protein CheC [Trichodesmium erythraeum GBRTRLIN201]|nr:chemotaxis protein CheC [Trichodesmium erythraeum GBRTRLIN201]